MKTTLFFRTAFHPRHKFKSKALLDFGRVFKRYTSLTPRYWRSRA